MALLDITVDSFTESEIEMNRPNSGIVLDINADTYICEEIPAITGGGEYSFGFGWV